MLQQRQQQEHREFCCASTTNEAAASSGQRRLPDGTERSSSDGFVPEAHCELMKNPLNFHLAERALHWRTRTTKRSQTLQQGTAVRLVLGAGHPCTHTRLQALIGLLHSARCDGENERGKSTRP